MELGFGHGSEGLGAGKAQFGKSNLGGKERAAQPHQSVEGRTTPVSRSGRGLGGGVDLGWHCVGGAVHPAAVHSGLAQDHQWRASCRGRRLRRACGGGCSGAVPCPDCAPSSWRHMSCFGPVGFAAPLGNSPEPGGLVSDTFSVNCLGPVETIGEGKTKKVTMSRKDGRSRTQHGAVPTRHSPPKPRHTTLCCPELICIRDQELSHPCLGLRRSKGGRRWKGRQKWTHLQPLPSCSIEPVV